MADDISMLTQTSDNIQKLFELSNRIDERIKNLQKDQKNSDNKLDSILENYHGISQRVAVMESKDLKSIDNRIQECAGEIRVIEKRISTVELASGNNQDRWNKIFNFSIQLIWVVLASWVLMKMNLTLGVQIP